MIEQSPAGRTTRRAATHEPDPEPGTLRTSTPYEGRISLAVALVATLIGVDGLASVRRRG